MTLPASDDLALDRLIQEEPQRVLEAVRVWLRVREVRASREAEQLQGALALQKLEEVGCWRLAAEASRAVLFWSDQARQATLADPTSSAIRPVDTA